MAFHLPRVLSAEQVRSIRAALIDVPFVDGMQTGGAYVRNLKNNREAGCELGAVQRLDQEIQTTLTANNDFQLVAMPRSVAPCIFSSYTPGLFYSDHTDNAVMGRNTPSPMRADISMTIFLSDPSEYEGGALVLDTDIQPVAWKLPAGDAVLYPSYCLHRVDPVTRGDRRAAVTWIQSQIRLAEHRQVILDVAQTMSWMLKSIPGNAAHEHPEFRRLEKVRANLTRLWSEL